MDIFNYLVKLCFQSSFGSVSSSLLFHFLHKIFTRYYCLILSLQYILFMKYTEEQRKITLCLVKQINFFFFLIRKKYLVISNFTCVENFSFVHATGSVLEVWSDISIWEIKFCFLPFGTCPNNDWKISLAIPWNFFFKTCLSNPVLLLWTSLQFFTCLKLIQSPQD